MVFSMLLTQLSCGLLIRAAQISRRSSYEALGNKIILLKPIRVLPSIILELCLE